MVTTRSRSTAIDAPSFGDSASTRLDKDGKSLAPQDEDDEPVCRICLESDDPELGKLIVPCKCSGTARFIHEECLTSWRLADRKNGFYTCGMCGFRYRLRSTVWTNLAQSSSIPLITLGAILVLSVAGGFLACPAMQFAKQYTLSTKPPTNLYRRLKTLGETNFPKSDLILLGDGVREITSVFGSLVGDCRWSSPGEPKWLDIASAEDKAEGSSLFFRKTERLTRCGRLWAYETDAQPVGPLIAAATHVLSGFALLSLTALFLSWHSIQWGLLRSVIRQYRPQWAEKMRVPGLDNEHFLMAGTLVLVFEHGRFWVKTARAEDRLYSPIQLFYVATTLSCMMWTVFLTQKLVRWFIKKRVAKVEGVVLDIRSLPEVKKVQ
ncbi:hypothetical protein JCM8097_008447 [Rhodosporidiobolus ruineniae]